MSQAIIIASSGGLGNQMFQYAAAKALSAHLGGKIFFMPCSNPHSKTDYRPILFTDASPYTPMRAAMVYTQSDGFESWTPDRFKGVDVLYIRGHFQYLPSILPVLPFLRQEFLRALSSIRSQLVLKYNLQMPRRAAFLHIRRNYLEPTKPWTLQQAYYEAAMHRIDSKKSIHWYLVSDDVAWCRSQPWLQGLQIVDEPELHTLAFMSLCGGGAVIANSTFSWWGAILAGAPTVYPSLWMSAATPNLFPQEWIRV